ncbi:MULTISPECIES: oligopeptide ABC transporter substrate-binding protein [Paenibacillus]|uniref:oligopeptide ABC transporter substrate-binding protein n=1 Tax=Paenibacillus TaxID=44249 RepID=UPI000407AD9A|nr:MULTISPECIES: oligopeptide ABC transporter substrate-binding protein [Paenibacillus]KGP83381.1 ABC transporter substrate-binding protein [Paenibacillus sp. MAEPY2]KGP86322.1 ABC transporter substrate-binding protein [Paenibacillus sp. MAEPY1]OZQ68915.1 oligopeptide ABC transporter substrate-binding protein [Paenibacillus taichungensis]HBU83604.1 oligopeptide ABC transporter substrate-binding protein [Paenibacillus sp.]
MKKGLFSRGLFFTMMLVFVLALAACSEKEAATPTPSSNTGETKTEEKPTKEEGVYSIEDFNNVKTNEGTAIEGGSITYGLVSDTAFEGTLNFNFYSGNPDAMVLQWFDEGLLTWDKDYVYTNDGAATYETSEDGKTFTLTIRDNVNWHDGKPVTAEDLQFAYEVIGNKAYDGPRYDSNFTSVVGMDDYHAGKAKTISGIKVLSEKQISITYKESTPSLLTGGVWTYPLAKHIFGDMDVAKMSSSKEVREKPIGYGPFKVETITPGESVTFVKNDDYWRGAPKLDKVTLKVINPTTVVQELKSGGVDLVDSFPTDQYKDNANMSNVEFLGAIDRAYTYIGFKLGTWDADNGKVVTNPDAKMADKILRKAMWQAVDNDQVGKRFYNGLRWNATTLIPPSHPEFHDSNNPGVTYDPEAAKKLLDEAGYKLDGEFRTKPDGSPLEINFVSMTGGDTAEPLARYYVQSWAAIGLKVNLEMVEFNNFYDRVGNTGKDDPKVDVYQAAWGVGIDVDPAGLYGRDALYNFSRFSSEENDKLLAQGVSAEAFDVEKRKEIYNQWQQYMVDEVPVFPTLYRAVVAPVNKRVMNYAIGDGTGIYLSDLAVNADKAAVAE